MRFAKNIDLIVNILFIAMIALLVCAIVSCVQDSNSVLQESSEIVNHVPNDGDSPGAGYEAIGVLFMGGATAFAGIALLFVSIMLGGVAFVLLLMVVVSFGRRKKYEANGNPIFIRKNITGKIVFLAIFTFFGFSTIIEKFHVLVLIELLVFSSLLVMLIKARKDVSREMNAYVQQNGNY